MLGLLEGQLRARREGALLLDDHGFGQSLDSHGQSSGQSLGQSLTRHLTVRTVTYPKFCVLTF